MFDWLPNRHICSRIKESKKTRSKIEEKNRRRETERGVEEDSLENLTEDSKPWSPRAENEDEAK